MSNQDFDLNRYSTLKHRVEQLKNRVQNDFGPEKETAARLLKKVERKLNDYEKTHTIPKQNFNDSATSMNFNFYEKYHKNTTKVYTESNTADHGWNSYFNSDPKYQEDTRSEEEMAKDLGILYLIFGSTYCTCLNYHTYKIRFNKQADKEGAFYRVYSDIYEDDFRICSHVLIGFWPLRYGDDACGDMQFAAWDSECIKKYNTGFNGIYLELVNNLKDIWNSYFKDQCSMPLLCGPSVQRLQQKGYDANNVPQVELTETERSTAISLIEKEIDSGRRNYMLCMAHKIIVQTYHKYESLEDFLKNSGVVYRVNKSDISILEYQTRNFYRLVGYDYTSSSREYTLYLV